MWEIQKNSYFEMRSEWLNIKHIIGDKKEVSNPWLLITIILFTLISVYRGSDNYLSKCSTPTSSASSAPISLAICSNVFVVGVPSYKKGNAQKLQHNSVNWKYSPAYSLWLEKRYFICKAVGKISSCWAFNNYFSSPNGLWVNSPWGQRPNGLLTQRPWGQEE